MRFIDKIIRNCQQATTCNRPAIYLGERHTTYAELLSAARAAAPGVSQRLVTPLLCTDRYSLVPELLGTWINRSVAVPIEAGLPAEEVNYRISECNRSSPGDLNLGVQDALIIFTSGTTGRAKGVIHTFASLTAQIDALQEAWQWSEADRLLLPVPLTHVHGLVTGLLSVLSVGGTVELMNHFDAAAVWRRIMSEPILTTFTAVPTIYAKLVAHFDQGLNEHERRQAGASLRRLRLLISGSAPLPSPLAYRWAEMAEQPLLERYGSTEAGIVLSNPLEADSRKIGSVGRPLTGVQVRVSDTEELLISGQSLFRGYLHNPEATRAVFTADGLWFRSGDEARIDESDDFVYLRGRSSEIIKVGGHKVSALEVENALLAAFPKILLECAIVGIPDDIYGESIGLAYVFDGDPSFNWEHDEIKVQLKSILAAHQIPRHFMAFSELPRNMMGKVDRRRITDLLVSKK